MKNIKRLLITTVLCLPLSAWADIVFVDFNSGVPVYSMDFGDGRVGEDTCLNLDMRNTGTITLEGLSLTLKGDFYFENDQLSSLPPSRNWIPIVCFFPTHPGRHVKNLTVDMWQVNADGTIDALSATIRFEGRATRP